jgi:hypothetical protein
MAVNSSFTRILRTYLMRRLCLFAGGDPFRKNLRNVLAHLAAFIWDKRWRSVMAHDEAPERTLHATGYVSVIRKLGNGRGEKSGT